MAGVNFGSTATTRPTWPLTETMFGAQGTGYAVLRSGLVPLWKGFGTLATMEMMLGGLAALAYNMES
jgi:hypothetical protein